MSATEENRSITATEASVAGSSVAITEAEEDREDSSFSTGGGNNNSDHKIAITKSSELDISIALDDKGDDDSEDDEEYSAPGHFHALRTPAKLKGARSRSSSRSRPNSRRNSPSPERNKTAQAIVEGILGSTVSPSASVGSSLDGIGDHNTDVIDPDLLLDKLGFKDLDPNITQEEMQEMLRKHISSNSGLPTLNERMSEATMDDTQAFHDLSYHKKASTGASSSSIDEGEDGKLSPEKAARVEAAVRLEMLKNSGLSNSQIITTMAPILNTLDEGEEDLDDDDEEEDNVLDIPEDMIHLKKETYKNRDTMNSMSTLGRISSADEGEDDKDDDNADVSVPTSVFNELNVNEEKKREMLHRDTSMVVVTGNEPDYLEADEQDGLEADLEVSSRK